MNRMTVAVDGMSCGHCVKSVRTALEQLEGVEVESVAVGSATVSYDPARAAPAAVLQAVKSAGYEGHLAE